MRPIAHAFLYYMELKATYESKQQHKRGTKLRPQIQQIDDTARRVAVALEEVGKVNLSLTLGAHWLASSALQKATLITEATKCAIDCLEKKGK